MFITLVSLATVSSSSPRFTVNALQLGTEIAVGAQEITIDTLRRAARVQLALWKFVVRTLC